MAYTEEEYKTIMELFRDHVYKAYNPIDRYPADMDWDIAHGMDRIDDKNDKDYDPSTDESNGRRRRSKVKKAKVTKSRVMKPRAKMTKPKAHKAKKQVAPSAYSDAAGETMENAKSEHTMRSSSSEETILEAAQRGTSAGSVLAGSMQAVSPL
ncbi:hypothetical protein N7532_003071 [Penicillium argentinense]|uniref:Uncharacterized protein n=1 Tax=Penicillium argentinense TaxID=1131581 RepID=A0A9W9KEX0_9EURO|nr:uncharacterized protein N7532_003071 [Penicillium argentinense]KAJ5102542.1 hypothetical protein N7532_003071 [Penicillium argentinense]